MTLLVSWLSKCQVRRIAADIPGAIAVFRDNRVNFTSCGHLMLEKALSGRRSATTILHKLSDLADDQARTKARVSDSDLIVHILGPYHATQRAEFMKAALLARSIERRHRDHPECPLGLARSLKVLMEDLDDHQNEEERNLFPAIQHGVSRNLSYMIAHMMRDHADLLLLLEDVRRRAHNYSAPANASDDWKDLYATCAKLDADLCFHVNMEDSRLFVQQRTTVALAS